MASLSVVIWALGEGGRRRRKPQEGGEGGRKGELKQEGVCLNSNTRHATRPGQLLLPRNSAMTAHE